jgi:thiamine-phosphate pyrophosphorylase
MQQLYLISPPVIDLITFAPLLKEVLQAGDIPVFQLRLKPSTEAEIREAVKILMPICHAHDTAFVLNDSPTLAVSLGCDGAHIGKEDFEVKAARTLLKDKILGVSCYNSKDRAMMAAENGADYVAFGSFFPSPTKDTAPRADIDTLEDWVFASDVPAVAIGGITPENCRPIIKAGAHFLAVCSGIWGYRDGAVAAIKAFHNQFLTRE